MDLEVPDVQVLRCLLVVHAQKSVLKEEYMLTTKVSAKVSNTYGFCNELLALKKGLPLLIFKFSNI
jgi:hypothetical protein